MTHAQDNSNKASSSSTSDPFFSKNYGNKIAEGAKDGLVFGVKIAAVCAPVLLVSGLISMATKRD